MVSKMAGRALGTCCWLLGLACVLPALLMLGGVFWADGRLSACHVVAAYADVPRLLVLLANTSVVVVGAVCVALLLGVPTGFLCFRTDLPFRRAILLGCLLAACMPLYVTATCWLALCGMSFWLYRAWGAAWISGLAYVPLAALISGVCFTLGDRELEDTAALDTNRWGVFRRVSVPMGAWGVGAAGLVVAVLSVWDITVTDILMVRTFAEEIFTQFQLGQGPWTATAISLPMIGLVVLACALIGRVFRRHGEGTLSGLFRAPERVKLGRWRYGALALVLAGATAFFLAPLGALVRAVGSPAQLAIAWRSCESELLGTLVVSPLAASLCVAPAILGAWLVARGGGQGRIAAGMLLLLIAMPAPVVGIGLIKLLNRPGLAGALYDSRAGLVFAQVIRALPFAALAVLPAVKRVPRELEEAVAVEGGNWLNRLMLAVLPLSGRALLVAWLVAFILSLSELGASFLVVPPGHATLSIRFFTLIHYGVYPDAAGICLILLFMVGLSALGIVAVIGPATERRFAGR